MSWRPPKGDRGIRQQQKRLVEAYLDRTPAMREAKRQAVRDRDAFDWTLPGAWTRRWTGLELKTPVKHHVRIR